MNNSGERLCKRGPLCPDFLGSSLTTNSMLDSEEDFREEDVWGSNDGSDEPSNEGGLGSGGREQDDLTVSTPIPSAGNNRSFLAGKHLGGKGLGSGGDLKTIGMTGIGLMKVSTPSRMIPIGMSARSSNSHPFRRQSAPVNIPDWSNVPSQTRTPSQEPEAVEKEDSGPMVPPHELIAREYSQSVTFSVYSGAGRILRGRDLSSTRTAVLRQTGFLDS